jgi:hypothetical protein
LAISEGEMSDFGRPVIMSHPTESQRGLPPKVFNTNRWLFCFYSLFGMVIVPSQLDFAATNTVLSTVWLSFVLAISGMEAWLKFRAPFLPKPLALDVGRTIFPALNSVELALCASLWFHNIIRKSTQIETFTLSVVEVLPLVLPTWIVLLDFAFLTPKLVLRGKQVVLEYVTKHPESTSVSVDSSVIRDLKTELRNKPALKQDRWHVVYVVLEALKLVGLSILIKKATFGVNMNLKL